MGSCWSCDSEVTLKDEELYCNKCNNIIYYKCNNCREGFEIYNKESSKKLEECNLCGYFKCPKCNVCYYNCKRFSYELDVLRLLKPEIKTNDHPYLLNKVRLIIDYLISQSKTTDRRNCRDRNVPISYAKGRIKSLMAKFHGYKTKSKREVLLFKERVEKLEKIHLGKKIMVEEVREESYYGQEERDALNFLVCQGKFRIEQKVRKGKVNQRDKTFTIYERVENGRCPFLLTELQTIINKCEKCGKVFPRGVDFCRVCKPIKRGKHIGELRKVREGLTNLDICSQKRSLFKVLRNDN